MPDQGKGSRVDEQNETQDSANDAQEGELEYEKLSELYEVAACIWR